MKVDTIVVGAGLAGCFVTWELRARGRSVALVDGSHAGAATPVAAGLYNPLHFRDLSTVDYAQELVAIARNRIGAIEAATGARLHAPSGILRLFGEDAQRERWRALAEDSPILGPVIDGSALPPGVDAPFGAGSLEYAGYAETERLQSELKRYLAGNAVLREGTVTADALEVDESGVRLTAGSEAADGDSPEPLTAEHIVLCQGAGAATAPLFPGPKVDTLRGETLRLRLEGVSLDRPLHRGVYIVPRSDRTVIVGSTYELENRSLEPTAEARERLLSSLAKSCSAAAHVIEQRVGLRPISADGAPLAGLLHPRVAIVNGLGPKGVLFGPAAAVIAANAVTGGDGEIMNDDENRAIAALTRKWRPDRHVAVNGPG